MLQPVAAGPKWQQQRHFAFAGRSLTCGISNALIVAQRLSNVVLNTQLAVCRRVVLSGGVCLWALQHKRADGNMGEHFLTAYQLQGRGYLCDTLQVGRVFTATAEVFFLQCWSDRPPNRKIFAPGRF